MAVLEGREPTRRPELVVELAAPCWKASHICDAVCRRVRELIDMMIERSRRSNRSRGTLCCSARLLPPASAASQNESYPARGVEGLEVVTRVTAIWP